MTESDPLAWQPDEEDLAFLDVYGEWDPLTPPELAALMDGFPHPWWIVGGHAIEAFTGVRRFHEDIDLVVFAEHATALRGQLGHRFHLWCNDGGTLRVLDDEHPDLLARSARSGCARAPGRPWRVDCITNPSRDGRWVSRRDDTLEADLEDVTWLADDGIRYLNPEVALLFKARQKRVKDEIDLRHALPLMTLGPTGLAARQRPPHLRRRPHLAALDRRRRRPRPVGMNRPRREPVPW